MKWHRTTFISAWSNLKGLPGLQQTHLMNSTQSNFIIARLLQIYFELKGIFVFVPWRKFHASYLYARDWTEVGRSRPLRNRSRLTQEGRSAQQAGSLLVFLACLLSCLGWTLTLVRNGYVGKLFRKFSSPVWRFSYILKRKKVAAGSHLPQRNHCSWPWEHVLVNIHSVNSAYFKASQCFLLCNELTEVSGKR